MGKRKKTKKSIRSFRKAKEKHIHKLKEEPDSVPAITGYWEKEIARMDSTIKELKKKLKKEINQADINKFPK